MSAAPERMCVGCRAHKDKKELIRVVRNPEHTAFLDTSGKAAGRGAYICPNVHCLNKARKSRALERALGVAISDEIYNKLSEEFNG